MQKSGVLVPVVVVLACLPFACVAPDRGAPGEYRQAAFPVVPPVEAPPRAPAFNPAEDAPHTYGRPEQGYPRSPYTRILPQTKETRQEDGLWSAEAPVAAIPDKFTILKIPLPYPQEPPTREDIAVNNVYSGVMDAAAQAVVSQRNLNPDDWRFQDRFCAAAALYEFCVKKAQPGTPIYNYLGYLLRYDPARALTKAAKNSQDFRRRFCGDKFDQLEGDPGTVIMGAELSWSAAMRKFQERIK